MGCVRLPLRLLSLLVIAGLLVAAWLYRDQIASWARSLGGRPPPVVSFGTPGTAAAGRARGRLAVLARGADSVVLAPDEAASLLRDALSPAVRDQVDSLRLVFRSGRVGLTAQLRTARLPRELIGPLAIALRDREQLAAEGPIRVVSPGLGEWAIDRLSLRDFPLPPEAIPRLIGRAFGDTTRRTLELALPRLVRRIRVSPLGVTLFTSDGR